MATVEAYPCGKTEMDVIRCPDCLEHFKECAAKSVTKERLNETLLDYMALHYELSKHRAELKKRLHDRAKCRSLARRILKKKMEIEGMRKELSTIFYYDGLNHPFSHSERTCDPKNEKIREALRD
jgi:hypothetical protein